MTTAGWWRRRSNGRPPTCLRSHVRGLAQKVAGSLDDSAHQVFFFLTTEVWEATLNHVDRATNASDHCYRQQCCDLFSVHHVSTFSIVSPVLQGSLLP